MLTRGTSKPLAAPAHSGLWIWDCHRGAGDVPGSGDGFPTPQLNSCLVIAAPAGKNPNGTFAAGFTTLQPTRRAQHQSLAHAWLLVGPPPPSTAGQKEPALDREHPPGSRAAATHLLGYLRKMSLMTTMASCTT